MVNGKIGKHWTSPERALGYATMKTGRPIQKRAAFNGARLRSERVRRNMSASALGQIVGCSDETILSWERGRNRPSAEAVRTLSEFFGLATRALTRGE